MEQPKVSVIYYGAVGGIQVLARDVAAGAEEVGAAVRVRTVPDATPDDVRWADAVVLGSPSRYGNLAAPLKSYVQSLETVGSSRLREIAWSGFASDDGVLHGGHEATLMTLFRALLHTGGVVVPPPLADDLDARTLARRTGRAVADVARRLLVGAAAEGAQVPVAR